MARGAALTQFREGDGWQAHRSPHGLTTDGTRGDTIGLARSMTTTNEEKLLTAADLMRLYADGVRGELIRGVLRETRSVGQEHGEIVMNIGIELGRFIKPRGLGRLMGSDVGVWLECGPDTVREPDIAYIAAGRVPAGSRVTGYVEIIPDLVVEVASPGDSLREIHDRALMWLGHGVRLVWAVHPETSTVDVHGRGGTAMTLTQDDTLDGLDVLPGLAFPVSAVFAT